MRIVPMLRVGALALVFVAPAFTGAYAVGKDMAGTSFNYPHGSDQPQTSQASQNIRQNAAPQTGQTSSNPTQPNG